MTSGYSPENAALCARQRRCRLLLMLGLPDAGVTLDAVCLLNAVELTQARQDVTQLAAEILRCHHLVIGQDHQGNLTLEGSVLDQRLCLLHGLRQALRLAPQFVSGYFAAAVKRRLQAQAVDKALYDEHNLTMLVQLCSQRLRREFSARDSHFLHIWLQYSLAWRCQPQFSAPQCQWLQDKKEYTLAQEIMRCWRKRGYRTEAGDPALLTLLFSQLHAPKAQDVASDGERCLAQAVESAIEHFQQLVGCNFHHKPDLSTRLYTHLSLALERALFNIGIADNLGENIPLHYPRLLRTTRKALAGFEKQYAVTFPPEEVALITIIFGAWLLQEHAMQEKQVLLLTGENPALEHHIEQQLREITLLPLNINYQNVNDFQRDSAPPGVALVVSPYATSLPLYSPPLIQADLPLGERQQKSIRMLLES